MDKSFQFLIKNKLFSKYSNMVEKGKISNAIKNVITSAQYNTSLETMDLIEEGQEIVCIEIPTNGETPVTHLVLLKEFVRMNLGRGMFNNPYTRNNVEFSEEDTDKLNSLKKEVLKSLKKLPHDTFIKFVNVLNIAHQKKVELLYFPDIAKIFQILLGVIPFFERVDELTNSENENISNAVREIENSLDSTINTFSEELADEEKIKKNLEDIGFLTIPDFIKEQITYLFHEFVELLAGLGESSSEFTYKDEILDIFIILDNVHYFLCTEIIYNEEFEVKVLCLMCEASEKMTALKETSMKIRQENL